MSDTTIDTSNQDGNTTTSEDTSGAGDAFKPITSQEDLNRIIAERVNRERAKYADYKDVKSKAARLDELEEANKTELQRVTDAKAAVERERDAARVEALRLRIATKHGISDEDADLFLTGTDEETLTKQAQRLSARSKTSKQHGNYVPGEGTNPKASDNDERATVRGLFGTGA